MQRPNRQQLELRTTDLEGLLPADHRARVVWDFVQGLDLRPLYQRIQAVEGHAGRPAIDPAILMALWLYATLEGIGSARALERLCEQHDAYRWICGGVSVNYHTLAEFRVAHPAVLDELLTTSVAALVAEGLADLTRVAQDGVKVRASAGGGSFRRQERLEQLLGAAAAHVAQLRAEVTADPGGVTRRQAAARARAAAERQRRVAEALKQVPALAERRRRAGVKGPARTSTTDPDARIMKMADGGYRPAFNAQVMTTTQGQIIVGVAVTTSGTDQGQLRPMVEQVQRRYGRAPTDILADGGYVDLEDLRQVADVGGRVYAPPPRADDPVHTSRPRWRVDDAVIGEWRTRMGTVMAQTVYRERAATSECVNAQARNRGWRQVLVRGIPRVRAVLLWFALAHNLCRAERLRTVALRAT
ncbi:MAG TPA: IS1182 family transposase [Gemmatimonadales bacterium]|nr:IS1182 family transposase [Gemmatimonadales bacterium]